MPFIKESHAYPLLLRLNTRRVVKLEMLSSLFNYIFLGLGLDSLQFRSSLFDLVDVPAVLARIFQTFFEISSPILVDFDKHFLNGRLELLKSKALAPGCHSLEDLSNCKLRDLDVKVYGKTDKFERVNRVEIFVDLVKSHRFLILQRLP